MDSRLCFFKVFSDDNALAESKTGSLDYDREFVHLFNIFDGFCAFCEDFVSGCRDAVLLHKILGESLGAFDDSRVLLRTESADTCFFHSVDHAEHQWIIWGNYAKVDIFLLAEIDHAFYICGFDRHICCERSDTAVARSAEDFSALACKTFNRSVLSAAATYYQNFHYSSGMSVLFSHIFLMFCLKLCIINVNDRLKKTSSRLVTIPISVKNTAERAILAQFQ